MQTKVINCTMQMIFIIKIKLTAIEEKNYHKFAAGKSLSI